MPRLTRYQVVAFDFGGTYEIADRKRCITPLPEHRARSRRPCSPSGSSVRCTRPRSRSYDLTDASTSRCTHEVDYRYRMRVAGVTHRSLENGMSSARRQAVHSGDRRRGFDVEHERVWATCESRSAAPTPVWGQRKMRRGTSRRANGVCLPVRCALRPQRVRLRCARRSRAEMSLRRALRRRGTSTASRCSGLLLEPASIGIATNSVHRTLSSAGSREPRRAGQQGSHPGRCSAAVLATARRCAPAN